MSAELTVGQLDELRDMETRASPSPWEYDMGAINVAAPNRFDWVAHDFSGDADGPLVVAMRNALPDLLAMARRTAEAERVLREISAETPLSESRAEALEVAETDLAAARDGLASLRASLADAEAKVARLEKEQAQMRDVFDSLFQDCMPGAWAEHNGTPASVRDDFRQRAADVLGPDAVAAITGVPIAPPADPAQTSEGSNP